jgi:site-specific recombinase XerD
LAVVEAPADESPVKKLVVDYETFLREERRLVAIVVSRYTKLVEDWLRDRFGQGPAALGALSGAEIVAYIRKRSPTMAPKSAKMMASALRSFLRYAHYRGFVRCDMAIGIPSVADWSRTAIPRGISQEHIRRVLAQCDRRRPSGRRDYAILMLLSRLGLRAGEVSSLTLDDDFDWDKGCLNVRGKGTENQLPLPPDVGQAIVAYLKKGRPCSNSRQVFLRSRAPFVGFKRQVAILGVVSRGLKRAGIDSPRKGCHQFRHALATEMLRRGASLGEIGELLRHRNVQTTTIYAKVDLVALRTLAQPWLGDRS